MEIVNVGELASNVVAVRPGTVPPVEFADEPALVMGDRRRLDRVVANLLDNADRHAGGAVRLAVCRRNGRVRIEVDDAGPGVDEGQRERVFDRFARDASAGQRRHGGGTGLGLALVAQHVQYHRGAVWIEDRPGGGARFVVELPEVPE
jgi:signal transduction histidine kinase